tara:strand:- start:2230 stop:2550 length:321 start_codon:yes stop_codon:yes gene_type:complete
MKNLIQNPVNTENKEIKNPIKTYIHKVKYEGGYKQVLSTLKNLSSLQQKNPNKFWFEIQQAIGNGVKIWSYECLGYRASWSKGLSFNPKYIETHYYTTTDIIDLER